MNNIVELRNELTTLFLKIKSGQIEHKVSKELNNTAGKIINTARAQLEYYALRKEKPQIAFLSGGGDGPQPSDDQPKD